MRRLLALLALPLLLLSACAESGQALSRAEATGVLNVGVVPDPPRVVAGEGGEVTGADADLVTDYAESIGASPTWQIGDAEALAAGVERDEVDIIIGADSEEGLSGVRSVGSGDATFLVGADEDPLRKSIDAWLAEQE